MIVEDAAKFEFSDDTDADNPASLNITSNAAAKINATRLPAQHVVHRVECSESPSLRHIGVYLFLYS